MSVLVAIALAFGARRARAAERTVTGVVLSTAGDPLPGAAVAIVDEAGVVFGVATTDPKGAWRLALPDGAPTPLFARVHVDGWIDARTPITPDDILVRTTLTAPEGGDLTLEVRGERGLAPPTPAQPTRYTVDGLLMTKLPGTRGDPFGAVTSLPSLGRPPALSTVYIIRGANPEESVTYVDGAPLPHAFHFGGLIAVVTPEFVESIAVVPGGFGAPFGRATAGIVDVSLASPRDDGAHGVLSLDAIDVRAFASTPLDAKTRVAVGARRSHIDVWIGKLLGDRIAGDLPRYIDGQILVERDFTPRIRARAALIAADDAVRVTDPNQPADKPRSGSWLSRVVRLHARADAKVGEGGGFFGVVALTTSRDTILGELDQWADSRKTLFARAEGSGDVGERPGVARLTVGADTLATHVDGTRVLSIPTSSFGGGAAIAMRGAITVERVEPAVYAQLAIKPTDDVTVTPGIRVDRAPLGELVWQPRLAVRDELSASTALKATAGLYSRPNVLDYVNARDDGGTLLPVAVAAGPVRGMQIGAGIEQALDTHTYLVVDVYGRTASGVLVALQQPARPIYSEPADGRGPADRVLLGFEYPLYSDTGRVRAAGAEILLRHRRNGVVGFIGYAIGRSEVREGPYSAWHRAPFDQTHVLNAAALFDLGSGWDFGARFRLAVGVLDSPYPATDIAPKSDPNIDPNRPLPELAPLHSLDLRLEHVWKIGATGLVAAYVEVRNVYDRRAREPLAYNYVYGYPVVGDGLPIIPNIGVKGSF